MFSPTTTASSTTIPTARMKAKSVIMLIDTPSPLITAKVPTKDTAMPTATQKASRRSRKRVRDRSTSASPMRPFLTSSPRRLSKICPVLFHTSSPTPAGSDGMTSSSRCSSTAATMSSTFSSEVRNTSTYAAG